MYNKERKKNITYLAIVLVLIIFSSPIVKAEDIIETTNPDATVLYTSLSLVENDNIIVDLKINPNNIAINAVGIFLDYSTSTLLLSSIDMENSFCQFVIYKTIDSQQGNANILCGLPSPGIIEESLVAKLIFKKTNSGLIDISIKEESMVLANDGLGTSLPKEIINTAVLIE
jgi:hypothetical protein